MTPHEPMGVPDDLGPEDELELSDLAVKMAGADEMDTMHDPDTHPKPPHPKEEGVTDLNGNREVDIMGDTPPVEEELGPTDLNIAMDGLPELDVEDDF